MEERSSPRPWMAWRIALLLSRGFTRQAIIACPGPCVSTKLRNSFYLRQRGTQSARERKCDRGGIASNARALSLSLPGGGKTREASKQQSLSGMPPVRGDSRACTWPRAKPSREDAHHYAGVSMAWVCGSLPDCISIAARPVPPANMPFFVLFYFAVFYLSCASLVFARLSRCDDGERGGIYPFAHVNACGAQQATRSHPRLVSAHTTLQEAIRCPRAACRGPASPMFAHNANQDAAAQIPIRRYDQRRRGLVWYCDRPATPG
jgi:hypothetical protein